MGENRSSLVYLDTGLAPVPEKSLADFSAYSGLPWRCEEIKLDNMLALLLAAERDAENYVMSGEK